MREFFCNDPNSIAAHPCNSCYTEVEFFSVYSRSAEAENWKVFHIRVGVLNDVSIDVEHMLVAASEEN